MKSVVPATSSLLSRFPAWIPGGALFSRPIDAGGATPTLPKNGCSGIVIPVAEVAEHVDRVELDDLASCDCAGEILGQEAAPRSERVARVVDRRPDGLEAHLEHVARVRAFDVDRTGENVAARARSSSSNARRRCPSRAARRGSSRVPRARATSGCTSRARARSTSSPELTRSTGSPAASYQPHATVFGVGMSVCVPTGRRRRASAVAADRRRCARRRRRRN